MLARSDQVSSVRKGHDGGHFKYWAGESASSFLPLPVSEESLCKPQGRDPELIAHCCVMAQEQRPMVLPLARQAPGLCLHSYPDGC